AVDLEPRLHVRTERFVGLDRDRALTELRRSMVRVEDFEDVHRQIRTHDAPGGAVVLVRELPPPGDDGLDRRRETLRSWRFGFVPGRPAESREVVAGARESRRRHSSLAS